MHLRIVNFTIFDMRCINPKFKALNPKQYQNSNDQNLIAAEFFATPLLRFPCFEFFDFGHLNLFRD